MLLLPPVVAPVTDGQCGRPGTVGCWLFSAVIIAGCWVMKKLNFKHKKFQYYSETLLVLCMRLFTVVSRDLQVSQE